jgi:hypothetical protein
LPPHRLLVTSRLCTTNQRATSEFDPLFWEHRIGYFNLARKARISRSVSLSFDRKMWWAPRTLTIRAVGTPSSSAFACRSVVASIAA